MVARVVSSLRSRMNVLLIAVVRVLLSKLPREVRRQTFSDELDVWIANDPEVAFGEVLGGLGRTHLEAAQCERLVLLGCEGLNAASITDACIAAFERSSGGAIHYSQEGEDIALCRYFGTRGPGFFVDVGAHHATRFSNTYALYRKGWRGVNIDAAPGSMESFRAIRPEDINLEVAISDKIGPLVLNVFKEGALNTFDESLSCTYAADGWEKADIVELYPRALADILDQYVPAGQIIDLLSVDVEGEDLGVLRSNNWDKYRPEVIVIEALDTPMMTLLSHPAITFLAGYGYSPVARLYNSVILRGLV